MTFELPETFAVHTWQIWLAAKLFLAGVLNVWEIKSLPKRPLHIVIRRSLFHLAVNPEWALLKAVVFRTIFWLPTGNRFAGFFSPIKRLKVEAPPKSYECNNCHDNGWVLRLNLGKSGHEKVVCSCQVSKHWRKVVAIGLQEDAEAIRNRAPGVLTDVCHPEASTGLLAAGRYVDQAMDRFRRARCNEKGKA